MNTEDLECGICLEILIFPTTLPCHHSFCIHCIKQVENNKCPFCRAIFYENHIRYVDTFIEQKIIAVLGQHQYSDLCNRIMMNGDRNEPTRLDNFRNKFRRRRVTAQLPQVGPQPSVSYIQHQGVFIQPPQPQPSFAERMRRKFNSFKTYSVERFNSIKELCKNIYHYIPFSIIIALIFVMPMLLFKVFIDFKSGCLASLFYLFALTFDERFCDRNYFSIDLFKQSYIVLITYFILTWNINRFWNINLIALSFLIILNGSHFIQRRYIQHR